MGSAEPVSLQQLLIQRIESLREFVRGHIPQRFQGLISADDVLQEVWISANPSFDAMRGKPRIEIDRWLRTLAKHRLVDTLRAARATKRVDARHRLGESERTMTTFCRIFKRLAGPDRTPSRELRDVEMAHTVGISLASLSADHRRAIHLRYFQGLSHREIAVQLNKSESAVNSLLFNGLRQLRALLGEARRFLSV